VFRRSRTSTDDGSGQDAANVADATSGADPALTDSPAVTAGKGRPTPKRSEAERRRRQPYTAPKDRKEASRVSRDRQRADRTRRMEAVRRGEEWAMPPRDRGPVKALARDYVDSQRRVSEYYMYGLLGLLVLLFVPSLIVKTFVPLLVLAAVLVMAIEGVYIGRKVKALAAKRLPGESTRGLALYAAMRALQIRKLRVPKPRVKPGDSF
jgi:hypothetical protein